MYSGTNIILVTNNESMIGLLSSELVQLRNIDSILIRNYQNTLETVESEKPQAIIINCQNSMEEPFCLDLIKKIKEISSIPIILLVESYNPTFIKVANKIGISDVLSIQYGNSEILMRTIWSLQKNELRQQHKKYEKLLTQLNAFDDKTGFYTPKYSDRVFQNEIDYLRNKGIDGVFVALEPNKNSRLQPSIDNMIDTIKSNTRATDTVAQTKSKDTFYLLLENTNLEGAMVVWNRINKAVGADEAICAVVCPVENRDYDEIEQILKEGLELAKTSPNFLHIVQSSQKKNDNWLDNNSQTSQANPKDFKLFRQIFHKKVEKIVKPAIEELIEEYKDVLFNTETPFVETDDSFSVKFVNKRQESEFKLTQKSNSIEVESIHNGLDSPENKNYIMGLSDITTREIQNEFEDFILDFKTCL